MICVFSLTLSSVSLRLSFSLFFSTDPPTRISFSLLLSLCLILCCMSFTCLCLTPCGLSLSCLLSDYLTLIYLPLVSIIFFTFSFSPRPISLSFTSFLACSIYTIDQIVREKERKRKRGNNNMKTITIGDMS